MLPIAVNPKATYVIVKEGNEKYILAKDRLEALQGEYQIEKEISGKRIGRT